MDTPEEDGQGVLFRRDRDQVYVDGHSAVSENRDGRKTRLLTQEIQINQTIGSSAENELARGSALGDVVGRAGRNASGNPRHSDDEVQMDMPKSQAKLGWDGSVAVPFPENRG
ncbi:hypothetical protein [Paludibaculum fermentans]|uniref:hypothetical protein n=1 Tax=Paludibaculum fermentans TaxID=1473598 RepID=UPI003EB7AE6B